MTEKLSEEALEVRREYQRKYRKENPDKTRKYQNRYWEKKAQLLKAQESEDTNKGDNK